MIREALHTLVRPLMRLFLWRLTRTVSTLPTPTDAPHAHSSGTDPDRFLLFGSGPAVGYGVLSHDLALPGQLARQVSASTGRGVDLDVFADTQMTMETAVDAITGIDLSRYDAVVLTIGANNALLLSSLRSWCDSLRLMLETVTAGLPARARVYVIAVPPISVINIDPSVIGLFAERHAGLLNLEARRLCAQFAAVTFVPFSPIAKADFTRYRSASTYHHWASLIGAPLMKDFAHSRREDAAASPPADESLRLEALAASHIMDSGTEARFDRIALLANQLLGTEIASITFIDGDRQWVKAAVGTEIPAVFPRAGSFGAVAISEPAPFVVHDATVDKRFADNFMVTGPPFARFYAGYPIESAFGERIGMVAVVDSQPRSWSQAETRLLRDIALLVQREVARGTR